MSSNNMSDYIKYRGKCKELAEAEIKDNKNLTLVKGYYYDALWGKQQHWWCKTKDNKIIDPSKLQFPTKGTGEYEEFQGYFHCEECENKVFEPIKHHIGQKVYCSYDCYVKAIVM